MRTFHIIGPLVEGQQRCLRCGEILHTTRLEDPWWEPGLVVIVEESSSIREVSVASEDPGAEEICRGRWREGKEGNK